MDKEQKQIRIDRLKYEKNKISATLCYGSIVFNALYFVSLYGIYGTEAKGYFYYMMGVSVVYNLIFMLAAFLSSEGVKNYKMGYSIVLIVIGALQIFRIFVWPLEGYGSSFILNIIENISPEITSTILKQSMSLVKFIVLSLFLLLSSGMSITAGVFGIIRSKQLNNHLKELDAQKVNAEE